MILRGLHLDGFGVFHDFALDNLSAGLQAFLGPNEAGKTTLLAFVRRLFFGFPTKKGTNNQYEPQEGGQHGGWVTVETQEGSTFRVERRPGPHGGPVTLVGPGDSQGDAGDWQRLLGSATQDLFESVYAFGLGELQDFGTLSQEGIRNRIYGAGLGLGGGALSDVQRELEKEAAHLFRPSGQNPRLNRLFSELTQTNGRIRELQEQFQSYAPKRQELVAKGEELERKQDERGQLRTECRRLEALLQAHGPYLSLCEAEDALATLSVVEVFPADGTARLERLLASIGELQTSLDAQTRKREDLERGIEEMPVDEAVLTVGPRIESLTQSLGSIRELRTGLPAQRAELAQSEAALRDTLRGLGPEWDESSVLSLDRSLAVEEQITASGLIWRRPVRPSAKRTLHSPTHSNNLRPPNEIWENPARRLPHRPLPKQSAQRSGPRAAKRCASSGCCCPSARTLVVDWTTCPPVSRTWKSAGCTWSQMPSHRCCRGGRCSPSARRPWRHSLGLCLRAEAPASTGCSWRPCCCSAPRTSGGGTG